MKLKSSMKIENTKQLGQVEVLEEEKTRKSKMKMDVMDMFQILMKRMKNKIGERVEEDEREMRGRIKENKR